VPFICPFIFVRDGILRDRRCSCKTPLVTCLLMDLNLKFWAIQTGAMMLTAFLLPGLTVSGPIPAFATVAALAFINAHLWDAALFFEIPQTFGQAQLIVLLANAAIFWLVVKLLPGIEIRGILPAVAAPVIFTITALMISKYEPMVDWGKVYASGVGIVSGVKEAAEEAKASVSSVSPSEGLAPNAPDRSGQSR
jgi:putative membrane protein